MGNNNRLDRGYAGEQNIGFFFGEKGYFIIDGPSGAAGHKANASGFDGVAYNPSTQHLIIYDNKAWARTGNVGSASSLEINLAKNLNNLIQKVDTMYDLPHRAYIRFLLRRAQDAIQNRSSWPGNVDIAVTNAYGRSKGVSQRLLNRGIRFIDVYNITPPSLQYQRKYMDAANLIGSLLGSLAQGIGDILIQKQVQSRLENELKEPVSSILMQGKGVLVIVYLQEWNQPDFQGRRAQGLLDVHIQGGITEEAARQEWDRLPRLLLGAPTGWRVVTKYGWIPSLK